MAAATNNIVLDFDVCQQNDCTSINFTELTGVYSSSNSGGYGTPNFLVSDAVGATIVVTLPSGVISPYINVYPTFPDSTGALIKTITASDLGLTGNLPDGVYLITYTVSFTVGAQSYQSTLTKTILLTCNIKCCVDKMIAKIPTSDCDCDDKNLKNALLVFGLYQALLNSGKCGNTTDVTNLLTRLNKLCISKNCGCN